MDFDYIDQLIATDYDFAWMLFGINGRIVVKTIIDSPIYWDYEN